MKDASESGEENVFTKAVRENAPSSDILALFLQEQKKELCNQEESLTMATYEFFFANKLPKNENPLKVQFDAAVQIIEKLITDGVKTSADLTGLHNILHGHILKASVGKNLSCLL